METKQLKLKTICEKSSPEYEKLDWFARLFVSTTKTIQSDADIHRISAEY